MAITTCDAPWAEGYNPNSGKNTAEVEHAHLLSHTVTYEGMVLRTGETNMHDDSDFWAMVWDEAEGRVRKVEYASTRGWTYHNGAKVDASDEVRAKAEAWKAGVLAKTWIHEAGTEIRMDVEVRSLTTKGVNKGLVGTVAWVGRDNFKSTRYVTVKRYGIRVEGESKLRYLSEDQVERTDTTVPQEEQDDIVRHSQIRARLDLRN